MKKSQFRTYAALAKGIRLDSSTRQSNKLNLHFWCILRAVKAIFVTHGASATALAMVVRVRVDS
jgi:hypothetical protein